MTVLDLIKNRRSIRPAQYDQTKPISDEVISTILEAANHAPTHRMTQPWRFKVVRGAAKTRLAEFFTEDFKNNNPLDQQSDLKIKKASENVEKSACVILIVMQHHADLLPEWEEVASTAIAVQNMWLMCSALGVGAYWSSPGIIKRLSGFAPIAENEKYLGVFYMGYSDVVLQEPARTPMETKVEWI